MFALDRRRRLLGLAVASTTAARASAKLAPAENPDLIRLSEGLPAIAATYLAAFERRKAIQKAAAAAWPSAPDDLTGLGGVYERDIVGTTISAKEKTYAPGNARMIATVEGIQKDIEHEEARRAQQIMKTKSKRGLPGRERRLVRLKTALPIAKKYWADIEALKTCFPYDAATSCRGCL